MDRHRVDRHRAFAGATFVAVGVLMLLGTVTAEAHYPGYSTTAQTISALGAASAPAASQTIFNATIIVSGLLLTGAAYSVHRVFDDWPLTAMVVVTALPGMVGVGVFPAQTGVPHTIAAAFSFGGSGVMALVATRVLRGAYRYVSGTLGALVIVAFALFVTLQGDTALGIGGLERWVFYLSLGWVIATGGYLLAPDDTPGAG